LLDAHGNPTGSNGERLEPLSLRGLVVVLGHALEATDVHWCSSAGVRSHCCVCSLKRQKPSTSNGPVSRTWFFACPRSSALPKLRANLFPEPGRHLALVRRCMYCCKRVHNQSPAGTQLLDGDVMWGAHGDPTGSNGKLLEPSSARALAVVPGHALERSTGMDHNIAVRNLGWAKGQHKKSSQCHRLSRPHGRILLDLASPGAASRRWAVCKASCVYRPSV